MKKLKRFLSLPAPAKLNLFLHVTGRRGNYHLLQSVFQLVDLVDFIDLEERDDGRVLRLSEHPWPQASDLCVKAARLLQAYAPNRGVNIRIRKSIPTGAGLGGGSSDAATVLIALNRMWSLNLSKEQLMKLALRLGADVPFFIFGQTAEARGVGEELRALSVPNTNYIIVFPDESISTQKIFSDPALKRDTPVIPQSELRVLMSEISTCLPGRNDLQAVAVKHAYKVQSALEWLSKFGSPRMTGSGSAVFCTVESHTEFTDRPPFEGWKVWQVRSLHTHPLLNWI